MTIVVQALGKTTREMRDKFKSGDTFEDFVGPLGLPQHIDKAGHVVFVGGGLGVAPIFPQLRAFKQAGARTTAIMGFRSKDLVFWEDKFREYADELIICTDDGSYGEPGFVTAALKRVVEEQKPDKVVAIGPMPMMHACVETTRPYRREDHGVAEHHHGRRHRHVRLVPRHRRHRGEVRLRRRPGFRRPSGRLQGTARPPEPLQDRGRQGERTFRPCLQSGKAADRRRQAQLQEARDARPAPDADARAQRAGSRHQFQGSQSRLFGRGSLREAERCIQCIEPTCIAGCPVGIDIPVFIRNILLRDFDAALETIYESSVFPSICGRVCPQETQCEAQCIIRKYKKHEPVAIGRLERFVGDNARAPKGKPIDLSNTIGKVAIVGSGPAGLAAAADLTRYGVETTVYEALHVLGGVLQYGIPSFRLPRNIIDREIQRLKDIGVKFETNKVVGKTFTIDQLMNDRGYDADVRRGGRRRADLPRHPRRIRRPGLFGQ